MVLENVVKMLNEQIAKEMYAANLYLSMSSWCYENSFDGAGLFLFQHAGEESDHAKRLITYLNETDSKVKIARVDEPESQFSSLLDVFEKPTLTSKKSRNLLTILWILRSQIKIIQHSISYNGM